ncbi:MAG: hypothetical protein ACWGMZ_11325 [Thermoguttaceae bacterium]
MALALTWPTSADQGTNGKRAAASTKRIAVGFAELPGSEKVFNINNQTWETRGENDDRHVPFLSISGLSGVVSRESAEKDAAFQLLLWLSSAQNSVQTSARSPATTLFCRSQTKQPRAWVEKTVSALAAAKYAEITAKTLRREQWIALRIPGREEYLATLDQAVRAAVRGELTPSEALSKAAKKWQQITEKIGVEQQRKAYLLSLGLDAD